MTEWTEQALQIVSDPVAEIESRKPAEFRHAIDSLMPYVDISDEGLVLQAPEDIVRDLDQEVYAALVGSVQRANLLLAEGPLAVEGVAVAEGVPAAVIRAVWRFVRRYWRQIVDAAKRAGKWAWWKSAACMTGAANALIRNYGRHPELLAVPGEAAQALLVAGGGCIRAL